MNAMHHGKPQLVCNAPPQLVAQTPLFVTFFQLPYDLSFFSSYTNAQLSPYLFGFTADNPIQKRGQKSKNMVQSVYQLFFKDMQYLFSFEKGPLRSHIVRKYTSTHMRETVGNGRVEKEYQIVMMCPMLRQELAYNNS